MFAPPAGLEGATDRLDQPAVALGAGFLGEAILEPLEGQQQAPGTCGRGSAAIHSPNGITPRPTFRAGAAR